LPEFPHVLHVENLTKLYTPGENGGGIRNVAFDVAAGEFYTLLGPSGCGKTTTLRCIAGLEEPSTGRMTIGNRLVFDADKGVLVPANQRQLGMVFQSYAVWPHMSVFENTAFPLRMSQARRWTESDIKQRVMHTLEKMELAAFAARSAAQLSGGQQQRLALARALVAEPRLLLLDEPLSNLDALLREQMRSELRRLQREVGVTAIYVTHDQSEALALSDRIAVMHQGRIVQVGAPQEIYHQPRNSFIAGFVGRSNILRGKRLDGLPEGGLRIETALGPVLCMAPSRGGTEANAVLIRPEHVVLTTPKPDHGGPNRFQGRITQTAFLGEAVECIVEVKGVNLLVRSAAGRRDGSPAVEVYFPPEWTLAISSDG
jgi:iron(III) transport system ATP-binding protein